MKFTKVSVVPALKKVKNKHPGYFDDTSVLDFVSRKMWGGFQSKKCFLFM